MITRFARRTVVQAWSDDRADARGTDGDAEQESGIASVILVMFCRHLD
jgi:hypothetical protein